jgi:hypothetical protein
MYLGAVPSSACAMLNNLSVIEVRRHPRNSDRRLILNTTIPGDQWRCSLHRNKASFSRMRAWIVMREGDLRSSMLR